MRIYSKCLFFFSKDVNFEYMKSEMGLLNNQIKYKNKCSPIFDDWIKYKSLPFKL